MDTLQHAPHTAPASSNESWRRVQQRAGPHRRAARIRKRGAAAAPVPTAGRRQRFAPLMPKGVGMLWTIFVILLVLWLLGMVSSYTMGGFIHLLLVIAIAVVLIQLIQGRRPVV